MTRLLLTLTLYDPAAVARLATFAKADLTHLMPKKILQKDGRTVTHYVRRYTGPEATRQAAQGTARHSERLAILRSWKKYAVADALHPQDAASAKLITQLEGEADASFDHDDWADPVGEAPRILRRVTDHATLASIQAKLDSSATHGDQGVRLVEAYDLDFKHPAFDEHAAEVGNVRSLYHGVGPARAAAVIATGLKSPREHGSTTGQMFGPGIYFSDSSTKSVQYITGKFARRNGTGIMLECDVALGNSYQAQMSMDGLEDGRPVNDDSETDWESFSSVIKYFIDTGLVSSGAEFAIDVLDVDPEKYLAGAVEEVFKHVDDDDDMGRARAIWVKLAEHPEKLEYEFDILDNADVDYLNLTGLSLRTALDNVRETTPFGLQAYSDAQDAAPDIEQELKKLLESAIWDAWNDKMDAIAAKHAPDEPRADHHSVTGLTRDQGGALQHPEFIVYDQDHCKVRRVLVVERQKR